ncbi:ubiquitin-protein ligase [Cyathus striatus]|nr:ubiquitin-protein ligase [Cyathus striatus]
MVVLVSSDNEQFTVDKDIINRIQRIKVENDNHPITLENVTSEVLQKVLEYCEYHRNDPQPRKEEQSGLRVRDLCKWDYNFFATNPDLFLSVITAAQKLGIWDLQEAGFIVGIQIIKPQVHENIWELLSPLINFTPKEEVDDIHVIGL